LSRQAVEKLSFRTPEERSSEGQIPGLCTPFVERKSPSNREGEGRVKLKGEDPLRQAGHYP